MKRLALVLALVACASAQKPAAAPQPQPPVARKVPHATALHGETLEDDYFWLRQKGTPEVEEYLRAEAAYADAMMRPTEPLQQRLYGEMLSRVQETDAAAPFRKDGYWYYTRTEQGKQYVILCRRKGSMEGPEQVLLDLNQLSQGKKFMALGTWDVSDDGNLLAYTTDETGFRQYGLHLRDLRTGNDGPDNVARVDSVAWSRGGGWLFYVVEDPVAKRPFQLWRHAVGAAKDDLMLEEKDDRFDLEVRRSRSRDFIFVTSSSHTTSEVRFFAASDPFATPMLVQPREAGHEYYVDHRGGLLYIRTNSGGRNFRLVTAPVWAPRKENWTEVVPHREEVMLLDVDLFANNLVLTEREGGLPQIAVTDLRTGKARRLSFPESDYDVRPGQNEEWDPAALRIAYQSPVTPRSEYDVDLGSGEWKLVKRDPVPNYDAAKYEVERIQATAGDGVRVPVAVIHRKGAPRDGSAPLFLYAYGSYGVSYPDTFDSRRFSLIDRGVTFAIAHIRGGGELGKRWHDQGRMMNKMNTFTDFIACAEHLVAQGYTGKDRLAIGGGSAGGLLMGAVTNLRPDLFHAVVAWVPFVDVLNTMLDESLPLTTGEFEEWGNPKNAAEFKYMRQYSPYDNVAAKAYPAMLVKSSYNDSQVMYWEPAKWVARLRASKTDANALLFKINMEPAGHGGASGRYDRLRETAFDYAFLLSQLAPAAGSPAGR
ncbi:MAG TPA: S9 family peptidase [Myxococcales bacterium]|nr:S9 family peptidase [Myxococcales bacterium]